jgi:glycosyltransferase involved in cell wall biosynthesis
VAQRWRPGGGGEVRLVTPGFVKDAKGLEGLLESVAAVPGARWTIAGGPRDAADEPVVAAIARRIEALGLGDRVRITGFLPRAAIDELLATATLAVFPYAWSAGSAAVAWAVGVGTPVLASDLPVFHELRQAGAGVELAPTGDPAAWTAAIRRLVASPGRRQALSGESASYGALHSSADLAGRMADLFRSVAP